MNSRIIIAIIVVIIIIGGGFYLFNKSKAPQQMNMQNMPTTSQEQTQTQTSTSGATQTNAKNAVIIQNFAFSPATITVKAGDTITWTNQDSVGHSATADDKSFDTGVMSQGQSKTVTFDKPGTYTYYCSVHPKMKGTVIVK